MRAGRPNGFRAEWELAEDAVWRAGSPGLLAPPLQSLEPAQKHYEISPSVCEAAQELTIGLDCRGLLPA